MKAGLQGWTPPPPPDRTGFQGRTCRLEPLSAAHVAGLREAHREDATDAMWRYLPVGPFDDAGYAAWVEAERLKTDPIHYAIRMGDGRLGGTISYLRINPGAGSIETGWLTFAPRLQRTPEATEAVYLLMRWAFEAGYRRFEWKCNAENAASCRAAERFGFTFEGIHRQAGVVKGRNRDTAWYSIIDGEWPAVRDSFESWLDPANFDAEGRQRRSLSDMRAANSQGGRP